MTDICLPIDATNGSPSFAAASNRVAQAALMLGRSDRGLGAVSGVRPGVAPAITATSATWTVTAFCAVADPETSLAVGPYLVAFTATKTGAMTAADSTYARLDRLDVQVPDDPAGSTTVPVIVYTAGVPAATPALPAAPARSFPLAQISVPKAGAGSPAVTTTFPYTVASGGIVPCAGSSMYPAHPYKGQLIYDTVLDTLLRWDGSGWRVSGAQATMQYRQATAGNETTLPIGVTATITKFDAASPRDTIGGFNRTTGVWTVPAAGTYELSGLVTATGSGVTRYIAGYALNGNNNPIINVEVDQNTNSASIVIPSFEVDLAVGDQVTLTGWVAGAAGSTYTSNARGCLFRAKRIR